VTQAPEASAPGAAPGSGADLGVPERLAAFRRVRSEVEQSILPLATSIDGVEFELQASLHHLQLRRGSYVMLAEGRRESLGQITELKADSVVTSSDGIVGAGSSMLVRLARGSGVLLEPDGTPFHDASVRPATPAEVGAWTARSTRRGAGLEVGELLMAAGVAATLDSTGLARHTFMCGQSGSGKSYSLGVLLERVLMGTSLRVVILDPNSDYTGLSRTRGGAPPEMLRRYEPVSAEVSVWGNGRSDHPLRLAFAELDPALQAAILGLDPVRDREEYAVLTELLGRQRDGRPLITRADDLMQAESAEARALGLRANNLGVLAWSVWSSGAHSLVQELLDQSVRCIVVDLGSLGTPQEQRVVAEAVLSTLWDARHSRRPCLIVVDEAHNLCPAEPGDAITRLSTARAIQIAGEGRKYGLYLLTSTQRPNKVHENVVSQCDNLLLMRMNSPADVEDLGRLLSFAPSGLLAGATTFLPGQALAAGRFIARPAYVRVGQRVSEEGGGDVPDDWAVGGAEGGRHGTAG
jgi:uncharacterized protein